MIQKQNFVFSYEVFIIQEILTVGTVKTPVAARIFHNGDKIAFPLTL